MSDGLPIGSSLPAGLPVWVVSHDGAGERTARMLMDQLMTSEPEWRVTHRVYPLLVGYFEWVLRLPDIVRMMRDWVRLSRQERPVLVVLVGSGWFCRWMSAIMMWWGVPTMVVAGDCHVQWASKASLQRVIRRATKVYVTTPDELSFVRRSGGRPVLIHHPVLSGIQKEGDRHLFCQANQLMPNRPILGVFPGIRWSEIRLILPIALEAVALLQRQFESLQVVVSVADPLYLEPIKTMLARAGVEATLLDEPPHSWVQHVHVSLVKMGEMSLIHAIHGIPHVGMYRLGELSYWVNRLLGRSFAKSTRYCALPNVLLKRRVIPELVGHYVNPTTLFKAMMPLLSDAKRYGAISKELVRVNGLLDDYQCVDAMLDMVTFIRKQET